MWFNPNLQITINLTTVRPLNEADHEIITEGLLKLKFGLKSPWPKHWYIKTIYLLHTAVDDETISVLVTIQNKLLQVRPPVLIRTVKKLINRKWTLQIANKTVTLASAFSPFYLINAYEESNEHFVNQAKKTFYSRYQEVYIVADFLSRYHTITKMFFCNQVELLPGEFTLNSRRDILFNYITNRYLFWFEFQMSISIGGIETAKVCIEDSGFQDDIDQSVDSSFDLFTGRFDVLISILTSQFILKV